MQMRPSKVLKKLRAGEIVNCIKFNLSCPRAAEIAAMVGFDCIWPDMEHVPTDWTTIEQMIRTGKAYDVDTMVRVARGCYSDYVRPLEADATGIMVPHVMSLEDARSVVWQTRFQPIGRRAVDGGNADGAYCMIDHREYLKTANEQRFVAVQIEDPEPLDDLDEIARLDGIDMIFFGPADFSHGIGSPGQWDHPLVVDARKRVAQVCRANGKFAATVARKDDCSELIEMGYRFLNVGADVVGLGNYFKDALSMFRSKTANAKRAT